jgi:hypothetical protein
MLGVLDTNRSWPVHRDRPFFYRRFNRSAGDRARCPV